VEAQLIRLRLHLEEGEIAAARQCAAAVAAAIGAAPEEVESTAAAQFWLPHLYLRWRQALGAVERAAGNRALALSHWRVAITLLETQRSTLTIEELRTAFLEDKTALYSDLVTGLLEEPGPDAVAAAFAVVERARARTLLERLLTTGSSPGEEPDATLATRRAELQQRLHWLYNQMLGEAGNRRADAGRNEEVRECEAALQRLEWQTAPPLAEAHPVDLAALQQTLAADQQALVYYVAGAEVLAFVVGRQSTQLFRHLCTVDRLEEALATWRFQLERAEMGEQLYGRHAERYQRAWQAALLRLYQLVIAPLAPALQTPRLLVIPFGSLHQLPFHALWDGESVLLERFEWTYAPSASIAVHTLLQRQPEQRWRSLAGLALTDAAIPAAQEEVKAAAGAFAHAHLYLDDQASLAGLQNAATVADVLHIATHGRFRPDNPFFSMLKLADGWVDVRSLYRLQLAARLVVLSACESGAGRVRGGDEVIGVARGFLAAGARSVIASLWNVHDASTAALMARFYACLTGSVPPLRPAAALRAAQLHAASERRHPFYWASFLAIG
jgi:CHAT domain-containing protein